MSVFYRMYFGECAQELDFHPYIVGRTKVEYEKFLVPQS